MRPGIELRTDYDAARLRALAKVTRNAGQSRRLLALAEIYDGGARSKAARVGGVEHRQHKGLNNRAENSHQPARRRVRIVKRFKSAGQAQRFLSVHDQVGTLFRRPGNTTAADHRKARAQAFRGWAEVTGVAAGF